MSDFWMVYLLSISGSVATFLGVVGIVGGLLSCGGALISNACAMDERPDSSQRREYTDMRAGFVSGIKLSLILGVLCALIPSQTDFVRAYVIVEGSKLVNAESAEAATKLLLERVDKLIEAVSK